MPLSLVKGVCKSTASLPVILLGAILLLRKKNSGWMVSSSAYNCLFTLHKLVIFGLILLIMWVGGFEYSEKYAHVIKVWPLA